MIYKTDGYPYSEYSCVVLIQRNRSYALDDINTESLVKMLNDPKYYREGDCGETFKDGKIIFLDSNCNIIATLFYGCGFDQLYFHPQKKEFDQTLLNEHGDKIFTDIISQTISKVR